MDRVFWEIAIGLRNGQSSIEKIETLHPVGDIRDLGRRMDRVDNPFHYTNIVFSYAEIGGKSNHPLQRQRRLLWPWAMRRRYSVSHAEVKPCTLFRKRKLFWTKSKNPCFSVLMALCIRFCFAKAILGFRDLVTMSVPPSDDPSGESTHIWARRKQDICRVPRRSYRRK